MNTVAAFLEFGVAYRIPGLPFSVYSLSFVAVLIVMKSREIQSVQTVKKVSLKSINYLMNLTMLLNFQHDPHLHCIPR